MTEITLNLCINLGSTVILIVVIFQIHDQWISFYLFRFLIPFSNDLQSSVYKVLHFKFIIQLIFIKLNRCSTYSDKDTIKSQILAPFYLFVLIGPFRQRDRPLFRTANTNPNPFLLLVHLSVTFTVASKFSLTAVSTIYVLLCMILGFKKKYSNDTKCY